jgi:hypothetical protein
VDEKRLAAIKKSLTRTKREICTISIYNPDEMQRIRVMLNGILEGLVIEKTS